MKRDRNTFFENTPNMYQNNFMPPMNGMMANPAPMGPTNYYANQMPEVMPINTYPVQGQSNIESRIAKMERQITRLETRVLKIENTATSISNTVSNSEEDNDVNINNSMYII